MPIEPDFQLPQPKCSGCRHYNVNPQDLKSGICKVFPPQLVGILHQNGFEIKPLLPLMHGDDNCGQHSPKISLLKQ